MNDDGTSSSDSQPRLTAKQKGKARATTVSDFDADESDLDSDLEPVLSAAGQKRSALAMDELVSDRDTSLALKRLKLSGNDELEALINADGVLVDRDIAAEDDVVDPEDPSGEFDNLWVFCKPY